MRQDYLEYTKQHADVYLEMLAALEEAETALLILNTGHSDLVKIGDVLPKVQQAIIRARQL